MDLKMNSKTKYTIIGVVIALSALGGYQIGRGDKIIVTKTVEVEKIVKDVVIEEKIVEKPGGERIIYRTTKDKSKSESTASSDRIEKPMSKKWILGLSRGLSQLDNLKVPYTISLDRRILSRAFVGVYARNDGEVGVSVKLTF